MATRLVGEGANADSTGGGGGRDLKDVCAPHRGGEGGGGTHGLDAPSTASAIRGTMCKLEEGKEPRPDPYHACPPDRGHIYVWPGFEEASTVKQGEVSVETHVLK